MKRPKSKSGTSRNKKKAAGSSKMDEESSLSEEANKNPDSLEIEKEKLRKEIAELQKKIDTVESQNIDFTRFADLKIPKLPLPSNSELNAIVKDIPDLDVIWRNDLYRYMGFYCVKETKTEYVFNFGTSDGDDETYSVQILINEGKCSLGKWVMPMSMNMNTIAETTRLDDAATVRPFLKNCKQGIDCYRTREMQYKEFKKYISELNNCEIDGNPGFTRIILRLKGVYNKPKDSYIDLEITLLYKTHEARPYDIWADWDPNIKGPTTVQKKEMKSFAKYLKDDSILEGFKKITEVVHPVYRWEVEKYVESPLELNNSSESDDESINLTARRKRKRIMNKRQKDREIKERWKKRQRTPFVSTRSQDEEMSDEEITSPTENHQISGNKRSKSRLSRSPEKSKEPLSASPVISKKIKRTKLTRVEASPDKTKARPGPKLRQTTISFAEDTNKESGSKKLVISPQKKAAETKKSVKKPLKRMAEKSVKKIAEKSVQKSPEKMVEKSPEKVAKSKIAAKKSTKIPLAKKNNLAEKKSKEIEPTPGTSKNTKSGIPVSKAKPRIVSIERIRGKASSTPISNRIRNRLMSVLNENAISPIASANESDLD